MEITVAVILVAAYLTAPFFILPSVCSQPAKTTKPAAYSFVVNGQQTQSGGDIEHQQVIKAPIAPLTVKIDAHGSAQSINEPPQAGNEWRLKFWCEVNASDFAIGLFTLFLFIATYFLWRETERLAKGGDDQAQRMLDGIHATIAVADQTSQVAVAMQEAASAMRQVAGVSEAAMLETKKTSQRELRAYLSVEPAGINQLIRSLDGMGHVVVRNVGKLPARNVYVAVKMMDSLQRDVVLAWPVRKDETSNRTIQPGSAMSQGSEDRIRIGDLCNTNFVFVYGTVSYEDGYGKPRVTNFCHRYPSVSYDRSLDLTSMVDETRPIITKDKARYHNQGNDAD
jgi:hypothetical protein